jgi:aminoglycoside phosphotransferase (APT) family kinase protein
MQENHRMELRWERAHDFLELPAAAIEARVRAVYPAAGLKDAQPLNRGLRNTNYRLTVVGAPSPLALRLYVADPAACAREAAILTHVAGRVPAPRVLGTDTTADPPYALLEWLDGEPLDEVLRDCDAGTALDLSAACGTVLAAIHETRFPAPGFLGPDLSVQRPMPHWASAVEAALDGPAAASLGPGPAARVRRVVQSSLDQVEPIWSEAALAHADFKPWNLLARQEAGTWNICGVLDWEFACAASPLLDFAIFLRDEGARPAGFGDSFAEAYSAAGGRLPESWRRLARLIDLLNLTQLLSSPGGQRTEDIRRLVDDTLDSL